MHVHKEQSRHKTCKPYINYEKEEGIVLVSTIPQM